MRASQLTVAHLLGLQLSHVRVLAGFVGGSFGMKAMVWPHVTLTAMAARKVGRPVRLTLTRPQLFTSSGHREEQEQRIAIGATRSGRVTAIQHEKLSVTSPFDDWAEPATGVSSQLYACEHYRGVHRMIRGTTMTPTFTRGAGRVAGRLHARVRDGRTGLRGRRRPRRPADAQPRAGRRPRSQVVQRRPVGVPDARGAAFRLGAARPDAAGPSRRGLADRHRNGRGGVPDRVLHA